MVHKYIKRLISLFKSIGRNRADISWKEINGIIRENKPKK